MAAVLALEALEEARERLASLPDPVGFLERLFAHAPVGFQIYTPDGHSLLTNRAFRELFESEPPPEYNVLQDEIARERGTLELIHRAFQGEVVHVPSHWYDPRELRQVQATGRRVGVAATCFPLFDATGKLTHVGIVFKDVTEELLAKEEAERKQAEAEAAQRRSAFLAQASSVLAESLDYIQTLKRVAQLAVPTMADWCTVTVLDEQRVHRRIAVVHRDSAKDRLVEKYLHHFPPEEHRAGLHGAVASHGTPVFMPEVDPDLLVQAAQTEEHLELLRGLGVRSCIMVPLVARARQVGVISLMLSEGPRRYTQEDLWLAEALATRAALAVENAQLYEAESRARAAAEEAADRLKMQAQVLDSMSDGVSLCDEHGLIVYTNPAEDRLFGYERGELIGKHLSVQIVASSGEEPPLLDQILAQLRARSSWTGELDSQKKDGSRFPTHAQLTTVELSGRRHWICVHEDISEQRRAAEEKKQQEEFQQYVVGIVSHDLRSPLSAIGMSASMLLRHGQLDEYQGRAVARIVTATGRAKRLIGDFLDFTQARFRGGIPIEKKLVNLHELTRQVVDEVSLSHPDRELAVHQRDEATGYWDPGRVSQIIGNLVTNALQHSPSGTPVSVSVEAAAEHAVLTVTNEGPPIPGSELPRLFEPFKRGHSQEAQATRGVGLGLYITRQLVAAHGGTIEAQSTAERGTTFVVRLPRTSSQTVDGE